MNINKKLLFKYADIAFDVSGDPDLAWELLEKERGTQSKGKEFIADVINDLYNEYDDMAYACDMLGYAVMEVYQ